MAKRVRIGDVVEIPTRRGLAYVQYTHEVERWGSLLRVLPSFFPSRPDRFDQLVLQPHRFVTFFPLRAAVSRKIFEVVDNQPLSPEAQAFPLFRKAGFVDREGKVHDWWLWDGNRQWQVGQLSPEQRRLPMLGVWNDTLLIARIEEEWLPETDIR